MRCASVIKHRAEDLRPCFVRNSPTVHRKMVTKAAAAGDTLVILLGWFKIPA
jgi:hypothetical protein